MKDPGLRVKLEFKFNTEDMEDIPVLDFEVPDPVIKDTEEIKVVKKPRKTKKKSGKELF